MVTADSPKEVQSSRKVSGSSNDVAVGVTGHRALANLAGLATGVDTALSEIFKSFPTKKLTVISSLAEGADRLVARIAVEQFGARLLVVLPLAQADYEQDFVSPDSKHEFRDLFDRASEVVQLSCDEARELAYEAAGREMLTRSDALIAVWDGELARGRGGTGAVVEDARRHGLPIAWVHAGNSDERTTQPTSAGAEQGLVTFENFPENSP